MGVFPGGSFPQQGLLCLCLGCRSVQYISGGASGKCKTSVPIHTILWPGCVADCPQCRKRWRVTGTQLQDWSWVETVPLVIDLMHDSVDETCISCVCMFCRKRTGVQYCPALCHDKSTILQSSCSFAHNFIYKMLIINTPLCRDTVPSSVELYKPVCNLHIHTSAGLR